MSRAFTLVELLAVVMIIALVTATLVGWVLDRPGTGSPATRARAWGDLVHEARFQARHLHHALEVRVDDDGRWLATTPNGTVVVIGTSPEPGPVVSAASGDPLHFRVEPSGWTESMTVRVGGGEQQLDLQVDGLRGTVSIAAAR